MSNYKNILVHVNSDQPSEAVLQCAEEIAVENGAKLTFVDVTTDARWPISWLTSGVEDALEDISHAKQHALANLIKAVKRKGVPVETHVLRGRSSVEIVRAVQREGYDLVITQAKGRNSRREGFFGTTANRLLRKCPCPVLLVQSDQSWTGRQVVAAVTPVNLDDAHKRLDDEILRHAKSLCSPEQPVPEVVAAWDMFVEAALKNHMKPDEFEFMRSKIRAETEHHLDDMLLQHDMGIGSQNVHFLQGDPSAVIKDYLADKKNALLVIGTIGRAGLSGLLLGNTAEQVLSSVNCSILAVKPEGFVSPITVQDEVQAAKKMTLVW